MQTLTIPVGTADGNMALYEAVPEEGRRARGAVVVLQEAFGVNDYIEDVCRRLAELDYHAVAPHLFHRSGVASVPYGDFEATRPHTGALDDERLLADFDATLGHLTGAGFGSPQTAVVGFCFGGRASFLAAVERPLAAAVSFYGTGIVSSRSPHLPPLVDRAPFLKTPWLGLFGEADRLIALDDVERLRTELNATTATLDHEVVVYPGAGHAFHNDRRDSFRPEVAEAAWHRAIDWLETHVRRVERG